MENLTSGNFKTYDRYTFHQDGSVINKTTSKPVTLEGAVEGVDDSGQYRLTNAEGVREVVKRKDIIEHFIALQNPAAEKTGTGDAGTTGNTEMDKMNEFAKGQQDDFRKENGLEPGSAIGGGSVKDAAEKKPKAEKAPKEPKPEKITKPAYVPDPAKKPANGPLAEGYTVVPLSNDKIRLIDDDVRQIRMWAWEGKAQKEIREAFNLHPSTCSNIIGKKLHPNLV